MGFARFHPKPKPPSPTFPLVLLATVTFPHFLLGREKGSVSQRTLEGSRPACHVDSLLPSKKGTHTLLPSPSSTLLNHFLSWDSLSGVLQT